MKRLPKNWLSIVLIAVVTLLTYGALIPWLGFYRDDWYLFSTAQSQGFSGIVALFQIDRPLVGYLYAFGYQLLGTSPFAWQAVTLLMRLAGNLTFFWLLRLLWPERQYETLSVALLFSIYPGYTVQPNAGVYITDLIAITAALLSFVLTIKVWQSSRRLVQIVFSIVAGLLTLFYLGIFESAIGLEVARLVLLGYLIWRKEQLNCKSAVLQALKADLLYLLLGVSFLIWRLFFFQSTRRSTNLDVLLGKYSLLPWHSLLTIAIETLKDIVETTVFAWVVPFYQFVASSNYRDLAIGVGISILVATCSFLVLRSIYREVASIQGDSQAQQHLHLIWLGLFIVAFALLPIDMAGRNVLFSDQWDRYTVYASIGVAMVVGGCVFHFFQGSFRNALLLVLIGMSVVVHFFSAAWYRDSWMWQRDLWQQMVWRAPSLRQGTMLFVILPPAGYEEGYEIYGPANMIYYPGQGIEIGGDVLNSETAANMQLQKNREHYDRSVLVADNYKNALIAVYPSTQSCLHVLDGRKVELPGLLDDSLVADVAPYSRINQIDVSASPAVLPTFLGGEQPRAWCYYYQKMDLARQQGNWPEVARLMDEAQNKGLTPEDVSEWMPALEAYAALGRIPDARHAAAIIRASDKARAFLCLQLQKGPTYQPPYNYDAVNQLLCQTN